LGSFSRHRWLLLLVSLPDCLRIPPPPRPFGGIVSPHSRATPLGEGYSGISVDQGTLYTMYRKGEQELAIATDAATGKIRWEYAYNASFGNLAMENGPGPHTTPLILGNRVYTVGILAILNCFDKTTGKLLWSKDLYKDFPGASRMDRGYSSSPDRLQEQHHSDDWRGASRGDRARSGRRAPVVGEERFRKFSELADAD
jgi:outer membrane protein assembly factor BamB